MDQGSDLNIIILLLVIILKLILFAITRTKRLVFYIRTADNNSFSFAKYIKFEFAYKSI
jgi:hypothetical protein